jgi:formylglycine-generating enzyme required for sulfatase activity
MKARELTIFVIIGICIIVSITSGCVSEEMVGLTETAVMSTIKPSNTAEPPPTSTQTATLTPLPTLTSTTTFTLSPSPTPVTSNAEWTPVIREFDSVEMALVPAGCFMIGTTEEQVDRICIDIVDSLNCDRTFFEGEQPSTEICFQQAFWIDLYEVTNAQYGSSGKSEDDARPRENVTWFEATKYCQSRGGRLPTEAEWEYAARGPDNLIYTWGNVFDGTRLNYCDVNCGIGLAADTDTDDGYKQAAPVGSYPTGVSWVGAYDLLGNVTEWTGSIYREYPYDMSDGREEGVSSASHVYRVLRGGAFNYNRGATRAASRGFLDATYSSYDVGFRCVMDYVPGSSD